MNFKKILVLTGGVLILLILYIILTSNELLMYTKTGIFLPISAKDILYQEKQTWMGDGDQIFTFVSTKEDLEKIISKSLGKGFEKWQQGPLNNWNSPQRIPVSDWIINPTTIENTDQIYYAEKDLGPVGYEMSEYTLFLVDFKTLRVIIFQHNA